MNRGFLGKDGKYYDDWWSLKRADQQVENQNKQTELMQIQAELMIEEGKQRAKERIENLELEQARQKELLEHDKEMRLLKLFDSISIPYDVFQKFKNDLFSEEDKEASEEEIEHVNEILNKIEEATKNVNLEIDKIQEALKNNNKQSVLDKKVKYIKRFENIEDFINGKQNMLYVDDIDKIGINNEKTYNLYFKWINDKKKFGIHIIETIIFLLISMFIIYESTKIPFLSFHDCIRIAIIFGIFSIITEFKCILTFATKQKLKENLNQLINNKMKELINNPNELQDISTYKEELNKINKKIKKEKEIYIKDKIDFLYEFRRNHYNMQIEKIFYDSGLIKECEEENIEFPNINKNLIIAEGTFEDYFYFFNNFKQEYVEYKKLKN